MDDIAVSPIEKIQVPEIFELLGKAYMHNPAHVAIFGEDNFVSSERLFKIILNNKQGDLFAAKMKGSVVGLIGMAKHPQPETSGPEPLQLTPESLQAPASAIASLRDRDSIWEKWELKERHYHFGPVAVLPEFQHQGIGGRMMEYCCGILDREREIGYLETESLENRRFYSRFGFQVIHEKVLFGIPAYSMKRLPRLNKT